MTQYLGSQFIGFKTSKLGDERYRAVDPRTGDEIGPEFAVATSEEVAMAAEIAAKGFFKFRSKPAGERAAFLRAIADAIEAAGDELIETASMETGLPTGRITGERGRTCAQLRLFASVVEEGSWVDARIDTAIPDREPAPKPDLRRMLVPIGPVAVFGASNFPLAFSTAGGDTASALAAGCPVVVKAHPAHPMTSEIVARSIIRAAVATGMPDGVFSMVHGFAATGAALVMHPSIEAVGFTGSLNAGRALFDMAAARPKPIPVFAEMGSINPVFLLPGAMEDPKALAEKFTGSLLLGCGQFCTNPGLVVALQSEALDEFVTAVSELVSGGEPGVMLTPGIKSGFDKSAKHLERREGVSVLARGKTGDGPALGSGVVFSVSAYQFLSDPEMHAEVFGPATLVVRCDTQEEMRNVARSLEGQLTASVHFGKKDTGKASRLIGILQNKAGRLIANGWPTGVEVCPSMQHGGPYPASTDSRFTSVGTAAIYRFGRPVSWQDMPEEVLPEELHDSNPRGVWRLVNGVRSKSPVS